MHLSTVDPSRSLVRTPDTRQPEVSPAINRTEESLREAFEDLRRASDETMNELRIMTAALRDEIDRRKCAEDELCRVSAKLAMLTAAPVSAIFPEAAGEVEEVDLVVDAPEPTWIDLAATPPAALLRDEAAARRTGTLLIISGAREKEIFFEDGRLFSCASNDPQKFLAERLVMSGIITEEQRRIAIEIKQAAQLALGRILLILGAIDEGQLVDAMRHKLEDEIGELLTWTDGRAMFVEGDVPSLQLVPLRIDVEALLVPPVVAP